MPMSIKHLRDKSVLNLAAHSVEVYDVNGNIFGAGYIHKCVSKAKKYYSMREAWIVDLILSNGIRVSEALSIRRRDIVNDRTVNVIGKKGSLSRVCMLLFSDGLLSYKDNSEDLLFAGMSRFYIYRVFKKLGIEFVVPGSKKKAVTHAGRHIRIQGLAKSGVDVDTIKNYIGHKSKRSTLHYAGKKR